MNDDTKLAELRKRVIALNGQIWAIEGKKLSAANKGLVGKCFKYRNCYSCPQTEKDYWWMYQRVTEVTSDGWLRVFRFQTDKDGKTEVEPVVRSGTASLGLPITLKQFQHAWKIQARMLNDRAREVGAYQP